MIEEFEEKFPEIEVHKFEISYNATNSELFNAFIQAYNPPAVEIPAAFIGNKSLIGYELTEEKLENEIEFCLENECPDPLSILGFLSTIAGLPCTGPLYLTMLNLIADVPSKTVLYLLLYNLFYALPLFVILAIVYKGTSPEEAEEWRKGKRRYMRLIGGLVMLACTGNRDASWSCLAANN